jgi:pyrrolidone-carboxylate peptidase
MATKALIQIPQDRTRILIYGFGPYRHFRKNVTEAIVRRFPRLRQLRRIVFPVRFRRTQFIQAVHEYKPDIILGLGQCSRGSLLRIEAGAYNRRRSTKSEKPRPIVRDGARKLPTNLPLGLGRQARSSKNPGDYVCNYSMYVMLDLMKHRHRSTSFGFIHVPHKYDPKKATRVLVKALGRIVAEMKNRY